MIPKPRPISRRTLLRGAAGAAMSLPLLDAMSALAVSPTVSSAKKLPVRMAVLYMANGVNVDQWGPKGAGKAFELSPTLAPTTPQAKEINPRLAFDRLFRSNSASSPQDDRSVLDLVADDAKSLRTKVGKGDQMKLDEYFDSVRAVEKRIEFNTKHRAEDAKLSPAALAEIEALDKRISTWGNPERQKLVKHVKNSGDHQEHCRLMLDMMVLAFWTDSTRVATFM